MGNLIRVKEDHGVLYVNPDVIGSIHEMPKGMDMNGREVEIRYVSGTLDFMTRAEWEQVKPLLVVGEETELQAALNEAIREGIALSKKLAEAEKRIQELEQAWKPLLSPALNPEYDWKRIGNDDIPFCKTCEQNIIYCLCRSTSKSTTEVQVIARAVADEAIRRADVAVFGEAGLYRETEAEMAEELKPSDPAPAAVTPGGEKVKIIRVEAADFFSKTSNSRRPMWRMTTDDGRTVTAFDHSDPLRDHKPLLKEANYLDMFETYQMGWVSYWDTMPILAEIEADGKFWKLIKLEKRTALQIPDRVDTQGTPSAKQMAVCKEAASMLERSDLVVFDCETTGMADDDEIVEIAGIKTVMPTLLSSRFEMLIKPTNMTLLRRPNKKKQTAVDIHGINETMLADAPHMGHADVLNLLSEFLDKKAWAAFNIEFDERLLFQSLDAVGVNDGFPEGRKNFCIQKMMNRYLGREYVSLDEACKALGIERSKKHRAMADAEDALKVLQALADKVPAEQRDPF